MITKLTTDLNIIQSLDAEPNDVTGLTYQQLQAKFDEGNNDIKTFINNSLTVDMDTLTNTQNTSIASANTKADNSVTTANGANSKADNAVSTSNTANSNAVNAVNTSNTANSNASAAVTTANTASGVATSANNTALAVQTDYGIQKPIMLQAVTDVNLKVDKSYVDAAVASFAMGAIPPKGIVSSMFSDAINNNIADKATLENLAVTNGNIAVNTGNILLNTNNIASLVKVPAYVVTTGLTNVYLANIPILSYVDGMGIIVKINVDSTASSTLNVNSLGAIPLKSSTGNDITGLKANTIYSFRYNSSTAVFQSLSEGVDASTLITNVNNILNM